MTRRILLALVLCTGLAVSLFPHIPVLAADTPKPAPALKLVDMDDNEVDLADFRGKVVLVNFWATWCPPCLKELPSMQSLWEQFRGQDFQMLAVNVGEDHDAVFAFLAEFEQELDFVFLLDETMQVTRNWPVMALPTTLLINKKGEIVSRVLGERDWSSRESVDQVSKLLAQ